MFFPFANYKTVFVDVDDGTTVAYTTTARSMVLFEYDTFTVGGLGGLSVFDYGATNQELVLFNRNAGGDLDPAPSAIVPSGLEVKRSSLSTSNVRIKGTLHIFELP